jgi:hypothetical protein
MAVSRALLRLLRIRDIQEEQSRLALESAMGELHRLEDALTATGGQDRRGRLLVSSSAQTGELQDRLAGLEETHTAMRFAKALVPRIEAADRDAQWLRQAFLARRVERRQAETLIHEAEAADAVDAARRTQMALDDWYRFRLHRGIIGGDQDSAGTPRDEPHSGDHSMEKT